MVATEKFKPLTTYVTYIAAPPDRVWQALTDPEFSKQYFFGFAVEVEPKQGGRFRMLWPDGRVHMKGEVVEWSPPRRFTCTWLVEGMGEFGELPESLVAYDIAASGEAVKLTMTESHSWNVPDEVLSGGRQGWPQILSSLKSLLETGKPLALANEEPPPEFVAAVKKAVAEKPWQKR
jgi:uncharacterized protein YndB with AHSA1/START domain